MSRQEEYRERRNVDMRGRIVGAGENEEDP